MSGEMTAGPIFNLEPRPTIVERAKKWLEGNADFDDVPIYRGVSLNDYDKPHLICIIHELIVKHDEELSREKERGDHLHDIIKGMVL